MNLERCGVVILCRYNSGRLPGKILEQIEGRSILSLIVERLLQVLPSSQIVIATSTEATDDPIEIAASQIGVSCYRGSLENVAERFFEAANAQNWDYAVRINGDNLFVDTELLVKMMEVAVLQHCNFVSNVKNRTFPKGMSIEIVRLDYFRQHQEATFASGEFREHVLLYFYQLAEEANGHVYFYNTIVPELAGKQLAIDDKEDLDRAKRIFSTFSKPHYTYNLKELAPIIRNLDYV